MKTVYLHIGTHKTGSTSIQRWLHDNKTLLSQNGHDIYQGIHRPDNHVELYLSTMRPERDSFAKLKRPEISFDDAYTRSVSDKVRSFIAGSTANHLVFTSEGLSLLRHPDELERLKTLIGSDYDAIRIILVLRDKATFLDRYRKQLLQKKGRKPSTDYWSCLYVEDDTWLTDYEALIQVYADAFGRENLHIIDYDKQPDILPALIQAIGIPPSSMPAQTAANYRFKSSAAKKSRLGTKLWKRLTR
ncbi:MAG: hypothetical protein Q7R22_005210 [Verrucomicrobiota bacterium JB025]|nr:hypothetical protein [Verrucomicrobiota bacterium JB025]